MCQREPERDGIDQHQGQKLAEQNFDICGRQREQQLVGSLSLFVCPRRHRHRRDDEQQQVRECQCELIQVCQVVRKELWIECGKRGRNHENHNKKVTEQTGKVAHYVALEHSEYYVTSHSTSSCLVNKVRLSMIVTSSRSARGTALPSALPCPPGHRLVRRKSRGPGR